MKHSEKLFFIIALILLATSAYFFHVRSMPAIAKQATSYDTKLATEAEPKTWVEREVKAIKETSREWPELKPQDEEGKWYFQVFTPPQIWLDDGKLVTESPHIKESVRLQFAYTFEDVKKEVYYINLIGNTSGLVYIDDTRYKDKDKPRRITLREGQEASFKQSKPDKNGILRNVTIKTGVVLKKYTETKKLERGKEVSTRIAVFFDKKLGKEITVEAGKPTELPDSQYMVLKASDGSQLTLKKAGVKVEKDGAEYEVIKVNFEEKFALVKMTPIKEKSAVRTMKVSPSGVEEIK